MPIAKPHETEPPETDCDVGEALEASAPAPQPAFVRPHERWVWAAVAAEGSAVTAVSGVSALRDGEKADLLGAPFLAYFVLDSDNNLDGMNLLRS